MELRNLENRSQQGYTSFASVWDKGEVKQGDFSLTGGEGKSIPLQSRITARWPDGSVKWAAHTADAALMGGAVTVEPAIEGGGVPQGKPLAHEEKGCYLVDTGRISARVPLSAADFLAEHICLYGTSGESPGGISKILPVLRIERRQTKGAAVYTEDTAYQGKVHRVTLEENGPLLCVFHFEGFHCQNETEARGAWPFSARLYFYARSAGIRCVYTFFYDGDENTDFLKGMGLQLDTRLDGPPYNRHVKFNTGNTKDGQGFCFHEAAVILNSWSPRIPPSALEEQMAGAMKRYPAGSSEDLASADLPVWNRYSLCQDSPDHFLIRKQTEDTCCAIDCMHGKRVPGGMAVCGEKGGMMVTVKDFWQKYPEGFEVSGLNEDSTHCNVWFYSPEVPAFDFRHYAARSYPASSYEGFPYTGASPYGIAVTSECSIRLLDSFPTDAVMTEAVDQTQKPPVYTGTPEYYHQKRAFGFWSLKKTDTEVETWLEDQLEKILDFYIQEVENRSWYGLFDYGDVMHTYDHLRHRWRCDMGGFAWQNTELAPTYWLWLYFLRTRREAAFSLAEAMSRHCSEVDFYHLGPMKGIGSRHNVRHWGCSCKEPRISMAGHHRFYYYLTGDYRIGDCMTDAKDADKSMVNVPYYVRHGSPENSISARVGPDWASFVSNWMTEYERTLNADYRKKIETGINDINAAPLGLVSGPEYTYDTENSHLLYKGEDDAGGMHLAICMGEPQVWLETAWMLENQPLKDMLSFFGRFYYLSKEEKTSESKGLIVNRQFSYYYFASGLAAYSAYTNKDEKLAAAVWKELLNALAASDDITGFKTRVYAETADNKKLQEIPWIKTNFASQWCLNVIMALEFVRDFLPSSIKDMRDFLAGLPGNDLRHS
jgi:hypothetical protein